MPERFGSSRLTRMTVKLLAGTSRTSSVCMLSTPRLTPLTLPVRRPPATMHDRAVFVEADPAAEEQIELFVLADREEAGVWKKKERFSGKRRLNRDRLICSVSTSTWAKSVL